MAEIIARVVDHNLRKHWWYLINKALYNLRVGILENLLKELASSLIECQFYDYTPSEGLKFLSLARRFFVGTHWFNENRLILINLIIVRRWGTIWIDTSWGQLRSGYKGEELFLLFLTLKGDRTTYVSLRSYSNLHLFPIIYCRLKRIHVRVIILINLDA